MEPRLVEFIKSLQRPGGGRLGEEGAQQVRITAFPPNTTMQTTLRAAPIWYAAIGYRFMFGADIVPNAFTGNIYNAGRIPLSGTMSQRIIEEGLWGFQLVTANTPIMIELTNVSGLVQLFEFTVRFIIIPSAEDLGLIREALNDLAVEGGKQYRAEALRLLRLIARGSPPRP